MSNNKKVHSSKPEEFEIQFPKDESGVAGFIFMVGGLIMICYLATLVWPEVREVVAQIDNYVMR